MPRRPLSEQLGQQNLGSSENEAFINEAIRRQAMRQQLAQQESPPVAAQPAVAPAKRPRPAGSPAFAKRLRTRARAARNRQRLADRQQTEQNDLGSFFSKIRGVEVGTRVGTQPVSDVSQLAAATPQTPQEEAQLRAGQRTQTFVAGKGIPEGAIPILDILPERIRQSNPNIPKGAFVMPGDLTKKDTLILRRLRAVSERERQERLRTADRQRAQQLQSLPPALRQRFAK